MALQVNGVNVHTTDLYNFTLGTGGNESSLNGNSSGFVSVSEATVGKDGDSLADYRRWYRTGQYQVGTADQRNGWNYVRVVHSIGSDDRETNYVEWVNDSDANAFFV